MPTRLVPAAQLPALGLIARREASSGGAVLHSVRALEMLEECRVSQLQPAKAMRREKREIALDDRDTRTLRRVRRAGSSEVSRNRIDDCRAEGTRRSPHMTLCTGKVVWGSHIIAGAVGRDRSAASDATTPRAGAAAGRARPLLAKASVHNAFLLSSLRQREAALRASKRQRAATQRQRTRRHATTR